MARTGEDIITAREGDTSTLPWRANLMTQKLHLSVMLPTSLMCQGVAGTLAAAHCCAGPQVPPITAAVTNV